MPLPGGARPFVSLSDPRWAAVLADPLGAGDGPAFDPPLQEWLAAHLQGLAAPDAAGNHARLAKAAEDELEKLAATDMAAQGKTTEDFGFFLAFAGEVMDRVELGLDLGPAPLVGCALGVRWAIRAGGQGLFGRRHGG